MIVICDIDNTVAYAAMKRGPFDYHLVSGDEPLPAVINVVQLLRHGGAEIHYWTGREEWCRDDTEKWLRLHVGDFTALVMRPNGNRDSGADIKRRWLREYREKYLLAHDATVVIEDQPNVATALRLDGMTVLCVGDIDFGA